MSRVHYATSEPGPAAAMSSSNSAAGTKLRRGRPRWCGTRSATARPCTVTVNDTPSATRRMISALLIAQLRLPNRLPHAATIAIP